MDIVVLGAAIVAVTEIIKRIVPDKKVQGVVTIIVAAVIGGLAGLGDVEGYEGITVLEGIIIGLGAAGTYRVGKILGGN